MYATYSKYCGINHSNGRMLSMSCTEKHLISGIVNEPTGLKKTKNKKKTNKKNPEPTGIHYQYFSKNTLQTSNGKACVV